MLKQTARRLLYVGLLVIGFAVPSFAQNDGIKTATRLGGPNRFYGTVRNRPALQRMMRNQRANRGITTVLQSTGLSSLESQIKQILTDADPARLSEVDVPVGTVISWMALRRNGRADVVRNIRWGGRRPFKAFQFTIDDMNRYYTFVVPQDCGNLALVSDEPSRERARLDAERAAKERADAETARAAAERAAREKAEAEAARAAKDKADADAREKARLAAEQAERDRQAAEAARLAAEEKARADAAAAKLAKEKIDWFIAPFVGKERRFRDGADDAVGAAALGSTICSPLIGGKIGPDIRLTPNVRFAPAIGAAFNTKDSGNTAIFADAEIRRELTKGFVGAGVGVWDLNHSDWVSPNLLLDFGILMKEYRNTNKLYFTGEGRLFLNQMDDVAEQLPVLGRPALHLPVRSRSRVRRPAVRHRAAGLFSVWPVGPISSAVATRLRPARRPAAQARGARVPGAPESARWSPHPRRGAR